MQKAKAGHGDALFPHQHHGCFALDQRSQGRSLHYVLASVSRRLPLKMSPVAACWRCSGDELGVVRVWPMTLQPRDCMLLWSTIAAHVTYPALTGPLRTVGKLVKNNWQAVSDMSFTSCNMLGPILGCKTWTVSPVPCDASVGYVLCDPRSG